jgi:hypothetical protein
MTRDVTTPPETSAAPAEEPSSSAAPGTEPGTTAASEPSPAVVRATLDDHARRLATLEMSVESHGDVLAKAVEAIDAIATERPSLEGAVAAAVLDSLSGPEGEATKCRRCGRRVTLTARRTCPKCGAGN